VLQVKKRRENIGFPLKWYVFAGMMFLSFILSLLVVTVNYKTRLAEFISHADHLAVAEVKLQETLLEREIDFITGDLRYLSQFSVMMQFLDNDEDDNLDRIKSALLIFASERNIYDQIRLLGSDGKELIRVECVNRVPVIIPSTELQDKSYTYYFKHAMSLRRGHIYVSPLDLNREGGVIEYPLMPTIRFAMGIYDSNSQHQGVLVLNYNAKPYLKILREASDVDHVQFMILNSDGYWLSHPDPEYEWGHLIPQRADKNLSKIDPQGWQAISEKKSGRYQLHNRSYTFDTFDLQRVPDFARSTQGIGVPSKNKSVESIAMRHIAMLPESDMVAFKKSEFYQHVLIVVVWVFVSILPCWGLAILFESRQNVREQLSRRAYYDAVTGLVSKELFSDRCDHALKLAHRHSRICAVIYIGLDDFKSLNDSMGHSTGDELLANVAGRLKNCVRDSDTVARMGSDEFAILLTDMDDKAAVMLLAEKINGRICDPFHLASDPVQLGASLGVAIYPEDGDTVKRLLEVADEYMYANKMEKSKNGMLSIGA